MNETREWIDTKRGLKIAICDTNIWYRPDLIQKFREQHPNVKLVATYLNLFELTHSPRINSDFQNVKNAIFRLHDEHDEIIDIHPISLFLNQKDQDNLLSLLTDEMDKVKFIFESILRCQLPNTENFAQLINVRKDSLEMATKYFNDNLFRNKPLVKTELHNNKYGYWNNDSLGIFKDSTRLVESMICGGVSKILGCSCNCKIELSQQPLFMFVLNKYYMVLLAEGNRRLHNNDWVDLFNIAYMKYGDYYITDDRNWSKIIDKSEYRDKFLFMD